jgi:Flp pilus assembly protein TadG
MTRNIRIVKDEEGSELVDFALCVPLLFGIMFGVVYFSFALYANHFVANAAKEAARYAVVRGSTWHGTSCATQSGLDCTATSTDIASFVAAELPPGLSPSNLSVTTTWPGTTSWGGTCDSWNGSNSPDCQVSVQVNYLLTLPLPFVKQNALQLGSSSAMTISE